MESQKPMQREEELKLADRYAHDAMVAMLGTKKGAEMDLGDGTHVGKVSWEIAVAMIMARRKAIGGELG